MHICANSKNFGYKVINGTVTGEESRYTEQSEDDYETLVFLVETGKYLHFHAEYW